MVQIINIIQIAISVLLIISILLQQRGSGSSAIMGGGSASYYTKRGFEKTLYTGSIVLAILFIIASLVNIIVQK